jgi:putative ABC transport system permease protein
MQTLVQDLNYSFRMFAKSKSFTTVAVLTLALGIGANTAIFSVINAVLLRPLPFDDPDRLVQLWETEPAPGNYPLSGADYLDWREQNKTLESTALFSWGDRVTAGGDGHPESVVAVSVEASFFGVLRVQPMLGRGFARGEDQPGKNHVVVLSHGIWQHQYGGDAGVIGKTVELNSEPYTVVGIMPRWLKYPSGTDVWIPVDMSPKSLTPHGSHSYRAVARLKSGIAPAQAQADLALIAGRLEKLYPDSNEKVGAVVVPLKEELTHSSREQLLILLGAVALVLLIACANIANLLLSRATGRQREIALRAALGASRWRIVRQLLTESIVLALAGACLGLLAASWGIKALESAGDLPVPRHNDLGIDSTVLFFTVGVSLTVGVLFGLAPAIHAARLRLNDELKAGTQASTGPSGGRKVLRDALVVSEIALSVALLVGAGLLLRTFEQMRRAEIGVRVDNVVTFGLSLPPKNYSTLATRREFFDRFLERLEHTPGIEAAAAGTQIPPEGGTNGYIRVPGNDDAGLKQQLFEWNYVTPAYFRALGITFLRGRNFTPQDVNHVEESNLKINEIFAAATTPPKQLPKGLSFVAVINNAMARRIWGSEDPIGKVYITGDVVPVTVIGVVSDVKAQGIRRPAAPQAYYPLTGALDFQMLAVNVVLRTNTSVPASFGAVRSELNSLDRSLAIVRPRTMRDVIAENMRDTTFQAFLLSAFAGLAVLLAAVGLYGVMAYMVASRTREIGIRVAMGAREQDVLRLVLRHGSRLTGVGLLAGISAALALSRVLRSVLFGVSADDFLTFAAVVVLLTLVALAACCIPAWRATRIDPLTALRCE